MGTLKDIANGVSHADIITTTTFLFEEKTSKDLTVLRINLCEIIFYKHM